MVTLIDTHAHLDHIEAIGPALDRAGQAGVKAVLAVSTHLESCRKNLAIQLSNDQSKIFVAMGMHPSDADQNQLEACMHYIREQRGHLTAIGEIGLDFWYKWVRKDKDKKDEQRVVFRALLELAKELDLPAVVHTRGTWRESFETVKSVGIQRVEFHWYSGPVDVLKDILDQGYYISASPSLAYSPQSREAISYAPIEQTFIETDSPVTYRTVLPGSEDVGEDRFQAEPKDVFKTLEAYCALKKTDREMAAEVFNGNAMDFFGIDF